jgi:hypothetical protein
MYTMEALLLILANITSLRILIHLTSGCNLNSFENKLLLLKVSLIKVTTMKDVKVNFKSTIMPFDILCTLIY